MGQYRQMVAVPIDPGREQDFVCWSALAVVNDSGLVDLPVAGGGAALPWGGRTGINARVVERCISDYIDVHPHISSLEVDVRSVSPAPRSTEIDEALISLIAAEELSGIAQLDGGTRIWDSKDRLGDGPSRDVLISDQGSSRREWPFEWRSYHGDSAPTQADVALIENASVHVAAVAGEAHGVLGLLPLRRFCPSRISELNLDQNFAPKEEDDLLGLSALLRDIESEPSAQQHVALRCSPLVQALGIGRGAHWEVLGAFNLDPALLSQLVASRTTSDLRLLWEWRPTWIPAQKKETDLARRPYFTVARIPSSLLRALESRQGLTTPQAAELLRILGQRGIGLSVLSAKGGTQESAAAGYFYAVRLLLAPIAGLLTASDTRGSARVVAALPIDPIESVLQALRRQEA